MNNQPLDRAAKKDERNRQIVMAASRNLLLARLHPDPMDLAQHGTPEDRARFVRKALRRLLLVMVFVALVIGLPWGRSGTFLLAASEPMFIPAGTITSIGHADGQLTPVTH